MPRQPETMLDFDIRQIEERGLWTYTSAVCEAELSESFLVLHFAAPANGDVVEHEPLLPGLPRRRKSSLNEKGFPSVARQLIPFKTLFSTGAMSTSLPPQSF